MAELWRYPVKSLGGERLERAHLGRRGIAHDRWWAVRGADGKLGSGKTTRRFRRMPDLLSMSAFLNADGIARIVFEDGSLGRVDDEAVRSRVSSLVGEQVTLAVEDEVPHLDDGAVHILTSASLRWLGQERPLDVVDSRRFRPNLVIDGEGAGLVEESWIGRRLQVGDTTLRVDKRAVRCVMVALAQHELPFAPAIVSTLERRNRLHLGVYATVEHGGDVATGDTVHLLA